MVVQPGCLLSPRACALVTALMILLACTGVSIAGDGSSAEPASTALPATIIVVEPTGTDLNKEKSEFSKTVDATHAVFERNILEQVIRLDSFFGNVKTEHHLKSEYQLRWRNSLRIEQDGGIKPGTSLWANLQLSRINERLHLVVSGENEPEPFSSTLPQDPGNPGFDRNSQSMRVVNTELRYGVIQTPSLDIFLGAGVRLIVPPEAFIRGRFQHTYKLSDVSLLRYSETLFVKKFDVFGETSEICLERLINQKTLLRWANTGTLSYEFTGMEWGSELSLIRELTPRSGITLTGGVYGNSSNVDTVGNYRILARYRRNFLRSWLFYELEPEFSWPRRADGSFPSNYALTFRLEVMFQGKEK